jgi:hypothetical protein
VSGNSASGLYGGGVYSQSHSETGAAGTITCTNNTISDNEGTNGGGVYLKVSGTPGGTVYAYNNIVWGNTATTAGGDVYLSKGSGFAYRNYNDAHEEAGSSWDDDGLGDHNIDADPLFVDADAGNYHLRPTSPCIDTGTNDAPALPLTDFEDDQRMIDGDHDGMPFADIGADEYKGSTLCDFDGDAMTDTAVYRASTGVWYIIPSGSGSAYGVGWGGDTSDIPVPGDYDGDGTTDTAVYRASTGAWYIIPSDGGSAYGVGWGGDTSDIPVPGDYDGDGTTDTAVYRASTGVWYIVPSGSGSAYGIAWGGDTSDIPVPGDYDGDAMTDIAVYRASAGVWYIIPSDGGGAYGVGWGGDTSDIPVPGDYDGDAMTDTAVYRASTGVWYIIPSDGGGAYGVGWGGDTSDIPVNPAAVMYMMYM